MLNLFFIFIAAGIFLYFCRKNILWGLGAIIVFLPSYLWRFKILFLPSTFLELMILILFFVWFLGVEAYRPKFWHSLVAEKKWLAIIFIWLLLSLVAWFFNPTIKSFGLWRAYFLEPVLFFVVLLSSLKSTKDYIFIVKALAMLIFWLAIFAIVQNFTGSNLPAAYDHPNVKRLTAVFSYPNALSLLSAALSGFLLAYYFFWQKKWEYLLLGLLGLFLSWWSVSQGALAGIATAFGLLVLSHIYQTLKNIRQRILFVGLGILLLAFFLNSNIARSFYQQLFQPTLDLQASSLEIRSSQWQETGLLLRDHWFTGAGLGAYQLRLIPYHQTAWLEIFLYPHNIFLNFWVELGLLGLLVFCIILFFIFQELKFLFLNKHKLAWPLLILWVIWLVHGLVDVPYFKNDLSLLFFIFLVLTIKAKYLPKDLQSA